ncbi:hypothetical protein [Pseudomonas quasicaspiana]|uniref:hypothetical protein n=1 Tax=Pseudomonas quasicaspiana TaxID=2829821 RepID=UPI001E506C59|nr:hypothetical protein [Pseudomonas quasicaspiana]MCD5972022.1 hypothetical protein [Pseudomonas quasicaspiana]
MIFVFDPVQGAVRTWTHGEIEGPCFIATITCMQTGQQNRAAVIECAYELHHYLSVVNDVEVKHVHMLCPPSVSGRSQWALEELLSIIMFRGTMTGEHAVVYRTAVSSYKIGELDMRRKKETRILYSQETLRRYIPQKSAAKNWTEPELYGAFWSR